MHVRFGERSRETYGGKPQQGARDLLYYAKRALARGDSPDGIVSAIATYRRYDKANPRYYAELTVKKAAESLREEGVTSPERP